MDEQGRTVVVCDIGTEFVKYGLAEDYSPIYKFPSDGLEIKPVMTGDEATKLSSVLDIVSPIKNGIIENWDEVEKILENIFDYEKLKINPKRSKVFITESPLNPKENRGKMLELMFEKFEFHSVFIGNHSAMCLFGRGLTSGVVVDFFDEVTDIAPVHFYPLKDLSKRFSSSKNEKISKNIFEIIEAADSKVQLELFKRIVLLSSSTVDAKNVEDSIRKLYLERRLNNDEEKLKKFKHRVDCFPSDNDQSFAGAALLAKVNIDKPEFWISKADFLENGINS